MSVVHDIVVKVLDGTRSWDEKKEPALLNALKGMVRSDIGHLYDRIEGSLVVRFRQIALRSEGRNCCRVELRCVPRNWRGVCLTTFQ
jgi:hypothetical protein